MNQPEIECIRCDWEGDWEGDWKDVIECDTGDVCPGCEAVGSIVETDSVNDDNYREDNPREVPNE